MRVSGGRRARNMEAVLLAATGRTRKERARRLVVGALLCGFALLVCLTAWALSWYAQALRRIGESSAAGPGLGPGSGSGAGSGTGSDAGSDSGSALGGAAAPGVRGGAPAPPESAASASAVEYWRRAREPLDTALLAPRALATHEQYVTFEDDTGGWNNIRMAFEVFVVAAKVTGRVLVMPPRCRFYLLDRGPVMAMSKEETKKKKTSTYDVYYDFTVLSKGVRIITTDEFLDRETARLGIPEEVLPSARGPQMVSNGDHTKYFLWLRESRDVAIWPTGPTTTPEFNLAFALRGGAAPASDKRVLHFPMHVSKDMRYLSGVPALLPGLDPEAVRQVRRYVRSALVYAPPIASAAAAYVELLGGLGKFAAIHVRRNELQYKSVFISGEQTAANVLPVLRVTRKHLAAPGEPLALYLATDEYSPDFFAALEAEGIRLVRIGNLRAQVEAKLGVTDPRHEGMIEQMICAAAATFIGTPYSSFSAHIFRLGRFMHAAPNGLQHTCLYHTIDYAQSGPERETVDVLREQARCKSFEGEIEMGEVGLN
jgi:hypothetical protein